MTQPTHPVQQPQAAAAPSHQISALESAMRGVNVMLMGPTGTGKTHSIGTLVDAGLEVFYLGLENGIESLIGYWTDRGLPVPKNLHWAQAMGSSAGFAEQLEMAKQVNSLSFEALAKMNDPNRSKYDQGRRLLTLLNNFVDERTGQSFGPVDKWDTDKALVVDGLSGINQAAMTNAVGAKVAKGMHEWGMAQAFIVNLIERCTNGCACHFVLLAHVERETDQVMGGVKIMPSTLGKAISASFAPKFSDVVLTERQGDKWTWSTSNPLADLKTRNLPISNTIQPTFAPILQKWKARKAAMQQVH